MTHTTRRSGSCKNTAALDQPRLRKNATRWSIGRSFSSVSESTVLYDLKNDPLEKSDVSREHPEEFARLNALLAQTLSRMKIGA